MSIQLTLYPQQYDGTFSSIAVTPTNFVGDANYMYSLDGSDSGTASNPIVIGNNIQYADFTTYMAGIMAIAFNTFPPNKFIVGCRNTQDVLLSTVGGRIFYMGHISGSPGTGETVLMSKMVNLTPGATYNVTFYFTANMSTSAAFIQMNAYDVANGTATQSQGGGFASVITSSGTQSNGFSFTAGTDEAIIGIQFQPGFGSTLDHLLFDTDVSYTGQPYVWTCFQSSQVQSGAFTELADGQVIVDLYEDEDIPLTLSIDDFTNVAEKVQSYSKAFKLPGSKRNNLIFDNVFEITRDSQGTLSFNPYLRTKCCLKENGMILFEGYLRLIDVTVKDGERSYNVNLYSDNIALADILKDRKFRDLGFQELEHKYDKSNIKRSWNDSASAGSAIAWTHPETSGFRTDYQTVKYPFVDWNHQFRIADGSDGTNANLGMPQLDTLGQAFRPWISLHYLVNRIFDATDFTYKSDFFESDDFKNMYMDFNWGSDLTPGSYDNFGYRKDTESVATAYILTGSFLKLPPTDETSPGLTHFGDPYPLDMGHSSGTFSSGGGSVWTAQFDNQLYDVNWRYTFLTYLGSSGIVEFKWIHETAAGATSVIPGTHYTLTMGGGTNKSGKFKIYLPIGDKIYCEAKANSGSIRVSQARVWINSANQTTTNDTILGSLRGDLKQWDFLKGLINMFNLVTIPVEGNKNVISIEPYPNVFNQDIVDPSTAVGTSLSDRLIKHDWTDKIDVSQIKLKPLTDLNKFTIFKYDEEDDDYMFNNYKHSVQGYLYGSKVFDASGFDILSGEEEIIAEPFAATIMKPLMTEYDELIVPTMYALNDDGSTEGIENKPRICYNNGVIDLTTSGISYYIPAQNGGTSANEEEYLRFSHLSELPVSGTSPTGTVRDLNYAAIQLVVPGVQAPINNLYNMYWAPYYNELYNPNTRTKTLKVNLNSGDIQSFNFNDRVFIINRAFRVNKIDYKPGDLSTVEFVLIP